MAEPEFRCSSFCGSGGCIEVAHVGTQVLVRDSRRPAGVLPSRFTRDEWAAFVEGVKAGEFDLP